MKTAQRDRRSSEAAEIRLLLFTRVLSFNNVSWDEKKN